MHFNVFLPFQAHDGTISQLRQYLVEMAHFDAVGLIDQAMEKVGEREETTTGEDSTPIVPSRDALGNYHVYVHLQLCVYIVYTGCKFEYAQDALLYKLVGPVPVQYTQQQQ